MVRRDFLKLTGLLSAALFVQVNPLGKTVSLPVEVESQGTIYRGSSDGKIYISANKGKTWQVHTNFGSEFSILGLATSLWGQVHAQVGFAGHSFDLALIDNGKIWKTV
jgi:hypothetical protein